MALNLLVKESLLTSLNKGGKGSGWFGPPLGTHVVQGGESTPSSGGGGYGNGVAPESFSVKRGAYGGRERTEADQFLDNPLPGGRGWEDATHSQRGRVKEEISDILSEQTDLAAWEMDDVIAQWAHSSNDHDMRSLSLQRDAAEELGIPLSKFTRERIDEVMSGGIPSNEMYPLHSSDQQKQIIRAMYEHTQETLANSGFAPSDTITLYRGVKVPNNLPVGKAFKNERVGIIKDMSVQGNSLESWSVSRQTAEGFAYAREGTQGLVLAMKVPIKRIVGTARTGFGCLTEGEFVIIGSGHNDTARVAKFSEG